MNSHFDDLPDRALNYFHSVNSVKKSAFSLVEVAIALGIISFALIAIMGLFPVAMKSAQESQRETRATMIAQQIFSDLRTTTGTNRMLVRGPSATDPNNVFTNFNLATSGSTNLAYDQNGVGLTDVVTSANFANGFPAATFLANITATPSTNIPNLARVQATIEAPAAAPTASRSRYIFVTLMNY